MVSPQRYIRNSDLHQDLGNPDIVEKKSTNLDYNSMLM